MNGRLVQSCALSQQVRSLKFDDHRNIFQNKSTWELLRALTVLRICSADTLVDNSLKLLKLADQVRLSGPLLRPTVYAQFVAGSTEDSLAKVATDLQNLNLRLMVAPTLEEDKGDKTSSQDKYDRNLKELVHLAEITSKHGGKLPCLQTKITALLSADTLCNISQKFETAGNKQTAMVEEVASAIYDQRKLCDISGLSKEDCEHFQLALHRLSHLGHVAASHSVRLMIDAEYSYVNWGCSLVTLALMTVFNQNSPVVANTYQCYFKSASDNLSTEINIMQQLGVCFAAKIVRGAYLEKERQLEKPLTCDSYEDTGANYSRVLDQALEYISRQSPDRAFLVVATHNEDSVKHAAYKIKQLGVEPDDDRIAFAQIYGMAEQISMPLVQAGYSVYKSVPVGELSTALPYLSRRLAENRSVLLGARKERQLLEAELRWRLRHRLHVS